ncbi:hypothetical protein [Actinokineospora sp. HUAS TT18]|uniref:hypothetical protein n=1 Tax=Actinokineospora sp. HUAS TT18 TaxID=3447451 RepID=UPI003F51CD43
MDCTVLAGTGSPLLSLLALAIGALIVGVLLTVAARVRRGAASVAVVLLMLAVGVLTAGLGSSPATAESGCPEFTIVQTSSMTGLAPGVAPTAITGTISNHGTAAFVAAVTVSIVGVATAPGAAAGRCDTTDYLLLDARMPVGRTVHSGEHAPFSGAVIGFNNTSANQDACKHARVDLRYVSS